MIKNFNIYGGPDYHVGYVNKQDTHGGVDYTLYIDPQMIDDLRWLRKHKTRIESEEKIRNENPAVASAYEQYQTVLKIVMDQI